MMTGLELLDKIVGDQGGTIHFSRSEGSKKLSDTDIDRIAKSIAKALQKHEAGHGERVRHL